MIFALLNERDRSKLNTECSVQRGEKAQLIVRKGTISEEEVGHPNLIFKREIYIWHTVR